MVSLKLQKRLAASILKCGKGKVSYMSTNGSCFLGMEVEICCEPNCQSCSVYDLYDAH